MSVTGGFVVGRRGGCPESEEGGSSTQTSAFNSAISTNSRSKTFLTTFWGRDAAGLNGPAVVREGPAGFWPEREVPVAAAARRSKPGDGAEVARNIGSVGSRAGSGISPSLAALVSV